MPPEISLQLARAAGGNAVQCSGYPDLLTATVENEICASLNQGSRAALLTRGVDEALDFFLQAQPATEMITIPPVFSAFRERLIALGVRCRALSEHEIYNGKRNQLAERGILLANPDNPSTKLRPLANVLSIVDRFRSAFVDETYRQFSHLETFESKASSNVFVFNSFSKAYALPGLRVGVLSGPKYLIENIRRRRHFLPFSVPVLNMIQVAFRERFDIPIVDNCIRNKELMGKALLDADIPFEAAGGNFFIVAVRDPLLFISELKKRNILAYDPTKDGLVGFVRISVCAKDQLSEAIDGICAAYRELH